LETKTCPFSVAASGTLNQEKESVVHGEAVVIWIDLTKGIFGLGAVAEFVSDLKRVSVECVGVVEGKQSDCPKESDGAREICRDGLLGLDLDHRQGHKYPVHDEVVEISVSYIY
jgi:hypothetical protein